MKLILANFILLKIKTFKNITKPSNMLTLFGVTVDNFL